MKVKVSRADHEAACHRERYGTRERGEMEVYVMRELKDRERDGRLTIWPARRGCLIGSAGPLGWRVAELTGRRLDSLFFPEAVA